ncbi:MAG TPA: DKNYY domain-containing protein, partial [Cytophaga sp.]|nr:DKNYY domain-containing protein [Cytophaga sp.]
ILTNLYSCRQTDKSHRGLTGNNIVEFVQNKNDSIFFTDPIDDTTNFKKVVDNIYKDKSGEIYIPNVCFKPISKDTSVYLEYFKNVTDFIDVKSYSQIKDGYFQNKGKVYMWWGNSDGEYPIEVAGADPKTFVPFDSIAGGTDKKYVFYDGVPGDFKIIQGADPGSIKVLNPERGCWNCGNCYFVDDKNVYYGLTKIEGADAKTFKLINTQTVDAVDKSGQYFEGHLIK